MEALAGCAELVQACAAMGRLEAVLAAEEVHARFCAVVADLALAVAGLGGTREAAPEDVGEDMTSLSLQLGRLRFACHDAREGLAAGLLHALTLLAAGARGASGARAAASAAEHLAAALVAAGLDGAAPTAWLGHELARLARAARLAREGADAIGEFFCKQVILCLLAHAFDAWSWVTAVASVDPAAAPLSNNGVTLETTEAELAASAESCEHLTTTSGTSDKENGRAAEVEGKGMEACASGDPGLLPTTSLVQQQGLQDRDAPQLAKEEAGVALQQLLVAWVRCNSSDSPLLPAAALQTLTAETASELLQLFNEERSSGGHREMIAIVAHDLGSVVAALASPNAVTQLAAVTLIEAAAEDGGETARAVLVELQAIPALLRVLQGSGAGHAGSRHPALRGAVAMAFRHLARDPGVRRHVVAAGAIPPLVAALQSPSAATQQAAARAISNLVVNSCESKLEAVKASARGRCSCCWPVLPPHSPSSHEVSSCRHPARRLASLPP